MGRNTSISLGNYFENFVDGSISEGRYKNASEVIRAGLRLLEEEENRIKSLQQAIQEGINSGLAKNFNPQKHLKLLKANKRKMAKYFLTNKAVEDLSKIWNYTCEAWSENQADKYYDMLIDFCREISEHPEKGKNYNEIDANILGFKANKHIIFYRVMKKNQIEITRILHERMDLKNRMNE